MTIRTLVPRGGATQPLTTPVPTHRERPSLLARLRLPGVDRRPVLVLAAVELTVAFDDSAFAVLLPEVRQGLGLTLAGISALVVATAVAAQLLAPLSGWLADRVPRVRLLLVGRLLSGVAATATAGAQGAGSIGLSRIGVGAGGSLASSVSFPLLADLVPVASRARAFGLLGLAAAIGAILAPLAAGALAAAFGWRVAVATGGVVALLAGALLLGVAEPRRGAHDRDLLPAEVAVREPRPVGWAEGWRAAAGIGTLRRLWFAAPFLALAGLAASVLLAFFFAESYALGPVGRGAVSAVSAGVAALGLLLAGPALDRLLARSPERVLTLLAALLVLDAVAVVAVAYAPVLWLAVVAQLPLGVGVVLVYPAVQALASLIVPARLRAFGMQTITFFGVLGLLLLPVVFHLSDLHGVQVGLLALVPVFLIGAAVVSSAAPLVAGDVQRARDTLIAEGVAASVARPLLAVRGLGVAVDGAVLLRDITFEVAPGEAVAIVGTNGSGKSSLLRALAGLVPPSAGAVFFDGDDTTFAPPHQLAQRGIALLSGGRATFASLTVREHLALGCVESTVFPALQGRLDQDAGTLSGGEQQQLALTLALAGSPRLLLIDELTFGLDEAVVTTVVEALEQVRTRGTAIVVVEQSVALAARVASRMIVLDRGEIRADGPADALPHGGSPAASMLTARTATRRRSGPPAAERCVLKGRGLVAGYGGVRALQGLDLDLRPGELVGVCGSNGSGKSTLLDVLSGHLPLAAGTVELAGQRVDRLGPHQRAGLGLVRSFQLAQLFPGLSVLETVQLGLATGLGIGSSLTAAAWLPAGARTERRQREQCLELLEAFGLAETADRPTSSLSTGQRHVVELVSLLAARPRVLLLDEPAAGLSQAETSALAPVLRSLATVDGAAVLVVEHDLALLRGSADRVLTLELGRLVEPEPEGP